MINTLYIVAAYAAISLVWLLGIVVLWKILRGDIDLKNLISEDNGMASMSRFQFLIFTFVIATGFLLLLLHSLNTSTVPGFPELDAGVLGLLGISGGSYVVSKGIQKSGESEQTKAGKGPKSQDKSAGQAAKTTSI